MSQIVALLAVVGAAAAFGVAASRWSHPSAPTSVRATAACVWAVTELVFLGLILGGFGAFWLPALLIALVVIAGAAWAWARDGRSTTHPSAAAAPPGHDLWRAGAGAMVGVVAVQWLTAAATAVRHGMTDPDSQHYHLTHAARFVQTGEVLPIHRVSAGDLSAFHPSNDELLRAIGLAATGAEASGFVWVAVTFAIVLLAAVAVGRDFGRPAGLVAVTAVVLALPGGGREYAGTAANDWAALGLLLTAVALWASAGTARAMLVSGLAAGLAAGTKLTVLGSVAAFLVAGILLPHRMSRGQRATMLLTGTALTGVWWYLRNWVGAGTPVPGLGLPFLRDPAAPLLEGRTFSVLHYVTDVEVVRTWFLPGLRASLGPAWWAVIALTVLGIVLAFAGGTTGRDDDRSLRQLLGVVAAVSLVAYLLTPTGAAGEPGAPVLFQFNVRYVLPAVVAAVWVVALRLPTPVVVAGSAGLLVVTLLPASSWADRDTTTVLLAGVAALAAAAAGRRRPPSPVLVAAGALLVAVVAGPITDRLVAQRYTAPDDRSALLAVGRELSDDDRVGVVGMPLQYAFTGPDALTRVEYVGAERPDGAFVDLDTCRAFTEVVQARGYDLVAVFTFAGAESPPARAWLAEQPAAAPLVSNDAGAVFAVTGSLDTAACP